MKFLVQKPKMNPVDVKVFFWLEEDDDSSIILRARREDDSDDIGWNVLYIDNEGLHRVSGLGGGDLGFLLDDDQQIKLVR